LHFARDHGNYKGGMIMATRKEQLTHVLKNLEATTPDIEASAVVSVDGLMIASELPHDVEEDRVAAMSAAMLSLGERTANELVRGGLDQVRERNWRLRSADGRR